MAKTVIKEIIIMLLLLLAIILALGVLFYDYVPITKIVPTVQAYQTPNSVTETLKNDILTEASDVIITREIDKTDLALYEETKNYTKGKANPFEKYEEETNTVNNIQPEQPGNSSNSSSGQNTNNNSNNSNNNNNSSNNTTNNKNNNNTK